MTLTLTQLVAERKDKLDALRSIKESMQVEHRTFTPAERITIRENLARVDDIRQELDKQLTHLQGQAEVATRYHALQSQVAGTQHQLWFARRQESAATRNRHARAGLPTGKPWRRSGLFQPGPSL